MSNTGGGKGQSTQRLSEYATNALEKIRKELRMFSIGDVQGNAIPNGPTVTPHDASIQNQVEYLITHLMSLGYTEEQALNTIKQNGRSDILSNILNKQAQANQVKVKETNGHLNKSLAPKIFRKPSIEREVPQYQRGSPALDSGAGSSRSDSPHQQFNNARLNSGQYSPSPSQSGMNEGPPLPLPRCSSNPTTPTPVPPNFQQMFKRISPATPPSRSVALPSQNTARGTSPVSNSNHHRPVILQNGPQAQHQLNQQMQALNLYQSTGEPPPPYPLITNGIPSNYATSIQSRQSPTQSVSDYRKSPSSGIFSATSAGSPSPITVPPSSMSPHTALQRPTNICQLGSWQRKTHSPIIMQSVKSTQVQKPILQTAIAPQAPASTTNICALPSYASSIQQKTQQQSQHASSQISSHVGSIPTGNQNLQNSTPPTTPTISLSSNGVTLPPHPATNAGIIPLNEPPSYASTMAFKAAQQQPRNLPPPPPYNNNCSMSQFSTKADANCGPESKGSLMQRGTLTTSPVNNNDLETSNHVPTTPPLPPTSSSSVKNYQLNKQNLFNSSSNTAKMGKPPALLVTNPETGNDNSANTASSSPVRDDCSDNNNNNNPLKPSPGTNVKVTAGSSTAEKIEGCEKIKHESPIPERKLVSKELEEVKECRIRHYSPQAFKFFMEQHIENVLKSYKQRTFRKNQLEKEMGRINLSEEAQIQMRKMLNQKESNYIRLKRAKMEKSMFTKLKTIGVGAFGEVTLVQKMDTPNYLYAMKTLKKADVLKRNQVAHVKAERDILAEADNEWVVKLYYSFQDRDNLYFVMDYIPGGDLMSLLIKKGIFSESLARFYIAELTCAVESVHKMGFIHRDIKPDNILIDRDGHIKLTDFGLCTGFRWTHDSKYYQKTGDHARQDSMEPWEENNDGVKPTVLERRRQREHQRCLAHSLVGTPNYIAPEVLERSGYTQLCDWWSVGVILYEMLVGQPPFLANTAVETQQKVINWESTLHIPPQAKLTNDATDLILRLCSSADRRLGKNADEVKIHPFFKETNFGTDLRQQKAPYVPKIEHPTDTSNFDEVDPERIRNSDQFDAFSSNTALSFHGFYGFTYRRFFTDDKTVSECNDEQGPVYV